VFNLIIGSVKCIFCLKINMIVHMYVNRNKIKCRTHHGGHAWATLSIFCWHYRRQVSILSSFYRRDTFFLFTSIFSVPIISNINRRKHFTSAASPLLRVAFLLGAPRLTDIRLGHGNVIFLHKYVLCVVNEICRALTKILNFCHRPQCTYNW